MITAPLRRTGPSALFGTALIGLWLTGAMPAVVPPASAAETGAQQGGCKAPAGTSHSATAPSQGASSGTAPGNTGTTGWTNGMGGTFVGTSNHAATPGSPQSQPETVTGANPGSPDQPSSPC